MKTINILLNKCYESYKELVDISDLVSAYNVVISNIKKFNNFTQIDVRTSALTSTKDFVKLFIDFFYEKKKSRTIFQLVQLDIWDVKKKLFNFST